MHIRSDSSNVRNECFALLPLSVIWYSAGRKRELMQHEQRVYPANIRHNGDVKARYGMQATDRRTAVLMLLRWFWAEYEGRFGPAIDVLTVGDPYREVVFREPEQTFNCNDKANNYLDEETIVRIIAEANGKLERDTKAGIPNHPRRSLRRRRSRRNEFRVVAVPNIHESNSGVFYYRIVATPQKSRGGVITQKRVLKDIKLSAKTLAGAIEEIKVRGLRKENHTARTMKKRSLKLIAHLAGLANLSGDDQTFFAPVLKSAAPQAHA